jgi:anti-sigma factor RsiW
VTCDLVAHDLDAYVDRELDPPAAAAVRDHVGGCAACRRRIAEREALGRLVRSVPYATAPDRLRVHVAARTRRSMPPQRLITWAAAAVLVLAIGASGLSIARSSAARRDAIAEQVVDGHVRSLMGDHLFDVRSTDQHTVKPWFLGKLDFAPPVADLAAIGFPLVGGRLDYLGAQPVAALVYQRRQHTINVFVSPAAGTSLPDINGRSIRGFHVYHWVHDDMSFWAVSDVNDAELAEFVRALHRS